MSEGEDRRGQIKLGRRKQEWWRMFRRRTRVRQWVSVGRSVAKEKSRGYWSGGARAKL